MFGEKTELTKNTAFQSAFKNVLTLRARTRARLTDDHRREPMCQNGRDYQYKRWKNMRAEKNMTCFLLYRRLLFPKIEKHVVPQGIGDKSGNFPIDWSNI